MRIDIITCLPKLLQSPFEHSIIERAIKKGLAEIHIHNLRGYSTNKHKKVDDAPFGGGAGMILSIEPIDRCISFLKSNRKYDEIIYMAPDGELLSQSISNRLSLLKNIIIICGHYKGIDQRVRDYLVTKEISIGQYVLTGGELAAAVLTDSIVRLIPGAISDATSALEDSFQESFYIAPPQYTRPQSYQSMDVPKILLSGNFSEIEKWRNQQSKILTEEYLKKNDLA